jgi:hypothetical protein
VSDVFITGIGVVSPAGWGLAPFREALARGEGLPVCDLPRPGWTHSLRIRPVPQPSPRPAFLTHARLRRTSPIAQYAVAAALEALGEDRPANSETVASTSNEAQKDAAETNGQYSSRLGIIFCAMSGCVNYSRRFYDETLKDPATASPLVFPETVFNAPSSHLASLLGVGNRNYTLVGDPSTFLQGMALGADWIASGQLDGCLIVGSEEMDWLSTEAYYLFSRKYVLGAGAGAVYLRAKPASTGSPRVHAITQAYLYSKRHGRSVAIRATRAELGNGRAHELLCDGIQGLPSLDKEELAAWGEWSGPRCSPKLVLGNGRMAAATWQCVAAIDALNQDRYPAATVIVAGCTHQAIAARFVKA